MTIKLVTIKSASLIGALLAISACAEVPQMPVQTVSATSSTPSATKPQSTTSAKLEADDDTGSAPANTADTNLTNTDIAGALGGGIGSPISGPAPAGINISAPADTSGLGTVPTVSIPNSGPSLFK